MAPAIARMGFLHNMGNPVAPPEWQAIEAPAEELGISVELFDVRSEPDIAAAFKTIQQNKIDALYVGIDALTQANADDRRSYRRARAADRLHIARLR